MLCFEKYTHNSYTYKIAFRSLNIFIILPNLTLDIFDFSLKIAYFKYRSYS